MYSEKVMVYKLNINRNSVILINVRQASITGQEQMFKVE